MSPRALNQLLKSASSFRFCQFIQDRPDHVIVRAVRSNARAPEELAMIRDKLQKVLGNAMQVTGEIASEAVIRPGGKIPLIVQQVKEKRSA